MPWPGGGFQVSTMKSHVMIAGAVLLLTAATLPTPANAFHNQFEFEWIQAEFPPVCPPSNLGAVVVQDRILQPVMCGLHIVCESDGPTDGANARPAATPGLGGLCYMDYDNDCDLQSETQPAHGGCGFLAPCPFPLNMVLPICGGIGIPPPNNPPPFSQYRMCDLPGNINGGPLPSPGNLFNQQNNPNHPCHHFMYAVGGIKGTTNQNGVCVSDDFLWRQGLTHHDPAGSIGSHLVGWLPHLVVDMGSVPPTIDDVNWPTAYGSYRTGSCTPGVAPFTQNAGGGVAWVDPDVNDDVFIQITGQVITDPVPTCVPPGPLNPLWPTLFALPVVGPILLLVFGGPAPACLLPLVK